MNKWLKGNGYWCPTCKGTGRGEARDAIIYEGGYYCQFYAPCSACGGQKRIAATERQVLDNAVPRTPDPPYHSILKPMAEYGKLPPSGRIPRAYS